MLEAYEKIHSQRGESSGSARSIKGREVSGRDRRRHRLPPHMVGMFGYGAAGHQRLALAADAARDGPPPPWKSGSAIKARGPQVGATPNWFCRSIFPTL